MALYLVIYGAFMVSVSMGVIITSKDSAWQQLVRALVVVAHTAVLAIGAHLLWGWP